MRNFIVGLLIGLILGGGICYAASGIVLQSGSGAEVGTTSNPLYIQAQ